MGPRWKFELRLNQILPVKDSFLFPAILLIPALPSCGGHQAVQQFSSTGKQDPEQRRRPALDTNLFQASPESRLVRGWWRFNDSFNRPNHTNAVHIHTLTQTYIYNSVVHGTIKKNIKVVILGKTIFLCPLKLSWKFMPVWISVFSFSLYWILNNLLW